MSGWNKLNPDTRNVDSCSLFPKNPFNFIRPVENSIYGIYDPLGIKLLNRLRQFFSHLREHEFRHNFADIMNSLCLRSLGIESMEHYFLCCPDYVTFFTTLKQHKPLLVTFNSGELVRTIIYWIKNLIG